MIKNLDENNVCFKIMTIHTSKGLEFDSVIFFDVNLHVSFKPTEEEAMLA